jgi:hypothetical protein
MAVADSNPQNINEIVKVSLDKVNDVKVFYGKGMATIANIFYPNGRIFKPLNEGNCAQSQDLSIIIESHATTYKTPTGLRRTSNPSVVFRSPRRQGALKLTRLKVVSLSSLRNLSRDFRRLSAEA